jgi:hypothetical protein
MNYFKTISAEVLSYYKLHSTLDLSRKQFEQSAFLRDYEIGKLTIEDALKVLSQLDHSTRKKLYASVLEGIDIRDPDERMLDLLDLMDPDKTNFKTH